MKAGIITWHKEINHGAVLQAYATQSFLEHHGCEAILLDHNRSEISMDDRPTEKLARWAKKLTPSKIKTVFETRKWNQEKAASFHAFRDRFIKQGGLYSEEQGINIAVVGSDMVFDFYEGFNPYVYGIGVAAPKVISYAASFGYTTHDLLSHFEHRDEIRDGISKMAAVGVRDKNTMSLVRELVPSANVVKTIDPVLLYGFGEESKVWGEAGDFGKPYILIYSYSFNMDSRSEVAAIRKLANDLGCAIVSVGYWHPWCDFNVNADPEQFVRLFSDAAYVVTDTFHGTVFSLIFEKQFRTIIRKNSFKVRDLLDDLSASSFIATNSHEIELAASHLIDYSPINENLCELRERSGKFLLEQVGEL